MVTTIRAERPARSGFFGRPRFPYWNANAGRSICSRKALRTAGMVPSHSGNTMTRWSAPRDGFLRSLKRRRNSSPLEPGLALQKRGIYLRDLQHAHFMSCLRRSLGVGLCERVAEVASVRVGVALKDGDSAPAARRFFAHASLSTETSCRALPVLENSLIFAIVV